MPIRVNVNHENTRAFLWYVISAIAERDDLSQHPLIPIPMIKGKTPFPKLEKYEHGLGPEYSAKEMTWKQNPGYDDIGEALNKYFTENIRGAVPITIFKRVKATPLTFPLTMSVFELEKLFIQYQTLKADPAYSAIRKKVLANPVSRLAKNPLRILFRGKEIRIDEETIQANVAEVLLSKPLHVDVGLDELVDKVHDGSIVNPKEKQKSMRNACYDTNQKVKKATRRNIFSCGTKSFKRIA